MMIKRLYAIDFFAFVLGLYACQPPVNRQEISLNGPWLFCVDSLSMGDSTGWGQKGFPEEISRTVQVPHAWNADSGLEKYWGVCWYEKKFDLTRNQLSGIIRIQFDGVYHDAVIYVNGKKAGEHAGAGYTRFFVNITPFVTTGINTIRVRVDNSPSRTSIPYMKSFDWANDGGIYRKVQLLITQPQAIRNIHVIAEPHGKNGVANIQVFFLDSTLIHPSQTTLHATITEENQKTQNTIYDNILTGTFNHGSFHATLHFDSIHPWHFDAPDLYRFTIKLLVKGKEKDNFSVVFGFRSIRVDNFRYVLNGEPMRLMGVEWMPGSTLERGMAETSEDFIKNLKLMKGANGVFTRFHWQQDDAVFDWCDRNGMLIQEEIPYWGGVTMLNDTLLEKGMQHLDEMTDAHYNHPSVIAWGIGNELASHDSMNIVSLDKLYQHAKKLDSSRLVTYVSNNLAWGFPSEGESMPDATAHFDIMMFNEYFSTWYGKSVDVIPAELDRIAREYTGKPFTISEWGLCEPAFQGGDKRRSREMVQQWAIFGIKPYVAGAIYFCLNDYRTHMGEDFTFRYPQRVHGVTDIYGNPKPSYDTLKLISSPVQISSVRTIPGKTYVTLRGSTGLPAYAVRNYLLRSDNENIIIDELLPGEEKTFELTGQPEEFSIIRPTGFEVINYRLRK